MFLFSILPHAEFGRTIEKTHPTLQMIKTLKDNFRCWGILTATFPEQVLEFLVRRLDTLPGTSVTRVRALKVIQYLINYETEIIKDNSNLVLRSLLPLQSSTNLQIRLQLLNVAQELIFDFFSYQSEYNTKLVENY